MRASNPASNQELLDALADYLVEQQFDLKALMRQIILSQTYQRSSIPLPENEADKRFSLNQVATFRRVREQTRGRGIEVYHVLEQLLDLLPAIAIHASSVERFA